MRGSGSIVICLGVLGAVLVAGLVMGGAPLPSGPMRPAVRAAAAAVSSPITGPVPWAGRAGGAAPAGAGQNGPASAGQNVVFLQSAPAILPGQRAPHPDWGPCQPCHPIVPTLSQQGPLARQADPRVWGQPPPAPAPSAWAPGSWAPISGLAPAWAPAAAPSWGAAAATPPAAPPPRPALLPFQEAHWHGLEVVMLTRTLARVMKIAPGTRGVMIDEATPPADSAGFLAGDVVTAVGNTLTPSLESFIRASEMVRDQEQVELQLVRKNRPIRLWLTSSRDRLGTANGEAAPMIPAGSRAPHGYQGPCTSCHRIGANGEGAVDLGDTLSKRAPPIHLNQPPPHRSRGQCSACHQIL